MFVVGGSQVTNHFIALVSYIPVHNNKLTQGALWGHPGVSMDYVNVSLALEAHNAIEKGREIKILRIMERGIWGWHKHKIGCVFGL